MTFRRTISVLLVVSQLFGLELGFAQDQGPSPELLLLEQAVALDGTTVPKSQMTVQLQEAVTKYLATARPQGQQARLADALVQLGMYTPTQASSFLADAQNASSHLLEGMTEQEDTSRLKSAFVGEVSQLMATHPSGAQFSACD